MRFLKRNRLGEKLIDAVKEMDVSKVNHLIKKGADINYKNKLGFTPLMYAVICESDTIIKILIDAGSNLEETNKRGFTALHLAKFNGLLEIYNMLKSKYANCDVVDNLRFSNIVFESGKKYSIMDIIKKEVYCENSAAKKLATSVLDNIEKYGDFRIELIMTCIALYTLEKDKTGNNLQIFVTDNVCFVGCKVLCIVGMYNTNKNIIRVSGFGGGFVVAKTLLHEFTHKVHLSCKNLQLDYLKDAFDEVMKRLKKYPNNQGSQYIKNNFVNRVEKISNSCEVYNNSPARLLEYLADSISCIIIYKKYKNDVDMIKCMNYILEPIYEVFDNRISNQLKEYVINSKRTEMINISDLMRKELLEYKNSIRTKSMYKQIPCIYQETKKSTKEKYL